MTQDWGQRSVSWPSVWPWATIASFVVGVAACVTAVAWQYERGWTPLQRQYLGVYAQTYLPSLFGTPTASYSLLYRVDAQGRRPATDQDMAVVPAAGARLEWVRERHDKVELRAWLRDTIYGGQAPWERLGTATWTGLAVFALGLVIAVPRDVERWRIRREGRRLRGPELVTTRLFNRRNPSDGIGFVNEIRPWWDRLLFPKQLRSVRIPRKREAMHVMIMGDSGTGKSALVRQLLVQVEARKETAIVYDPAREYTPSFYRPERGDVILNPLDRRMPYWSPADEVGHEAEALTIATSLFQDDRRENPFFVEGPRKVFAHLLTFKPSPQELVSWLSNVEEIDRRVMGTPLASLVYTTAPQQRGGMLASLAMVADSLKLLPRKEDTAGTWSAAEWARERKGWIFLTSKPEYRAPLRPLISLWLDLLVLRLMNDVNGAHTATWFVLDELASLQRLPQLLTAVTENRKSGNPVVLGFQGKSQLEARYGLEAEALLSQPATKIFLRTSEPESAEWISKALGEVEVERLRESRTSDAFPSRRATQGIQEERRTLPLVMPSQIAGLEDRHGYLKSGNLVVPLRFPYMDLPKNQEGFIPRGDATNVLPAAAAPTTEVAVPSPLPPEPVLAQPVFFE